MQVTPGVITPEYLCYMFVRAYTDVHCWFGDDEETDSVDDARGKMWDAAVYIRRGEFDRAEKNIRGAVALVRGFVG